jgi:hypothetical protein
VQRGFFNAVNVAKAGFHHARGVKIEKLTKALMACLFVSVVPGKMASNELTLAMTIFLGHCTKTSIMSKIHMLYVTQHTHLVGKPL